VGFMPARSAEFMPQHRVGSTPAGLADFMAPGFPVVDFMSDRRAREWIDLMPVSFAADRATAP
jgi:hypothetical protein